MQVDIIDATGSIPRLWRQIHGNVARQDCWHKRCFDRTPIDVEVFRAHTKFLPKKPSIAIYIGDSSLCALEAVLERPGAQAVAAKNVGSKMDLVTHL